jgi:small GTP-binding protein
MVGHLPEAAATAAVDAAPPPRRDDDARPIRIAFIGKPNVGKSSLVNCLLGEERVLVHDQPGTTRDPIDTAFSFGGREYALVDTAGMRRRRSIDTRTEHVSAAMARDQIGRCDVAVLVVDAREAATAEDARLAGEIEDSGRGALVVLNKKDLVGRVDIDAKIQTTREALAFLAYAPVIVTSAVTRAGVTGIVTEATRIFGESSKRVPTLRRPPRAPLLRDADERPPADPVHQHEPPHRHRPFVPSLPGQPAAQGVRLRGHAHQAGVPRPRPEEAGRIRRRGAVQKIQETRAVAVNENGFVPRFSGSDSRSAGSNR